MARSKEVLRYPEVKNPKDAAQVLTVLRRGLERVILAPIADGRQGVLVGTLPKDIDRLLLTPGGWWHIPTDGEVSAITTVKVAEANDPVKPKISIEPRLLVRPEAMAGRTNYPSEFKPSGVILGATVALDWAYELVNEPYAGKVIAEIEFARQETGE